MGEEEACNVGLGLGIGMGEFRPKRDLQKNKRPVCLNFSFPIHPKEEANDSEYKIDGSSSKTIDEDHAYINNNNATNCPRKKLRLTKDQSTLLEDSFKLHSTLNTAQKLTLAKQLNLRPRQVEVWFQNRRARTKLKQTEVDCEFLKKCFEGLNDENRRLKKELQELRSLKLEQPPPFYIQLAKPTTLTMCLPCEKVVKARESEAKNSATAAAIVDVVLKDNKTVCGLDDRS
ncbi:unnamed protein product [Ilex paraguariensis]|uniref:Homeobox domain-containing protein n=1 Tax=Ilex paraguariensis TaxID=185542 RepID=A0ABC8RDB9_9AQUA